MEGSAGGGGPLVLDPSLAASEIGCKPTFDAGVEGGGGDLCEERSDVDRVEGLREVDGHQAGSPRRLLVIEAVSFE